MVCRQIGLHVYRRCNAYSRALAAGSSAGRDSWRSGGHPDVHPQCGPFPSAIPPVLLAFGNGQRQAFFVVLLFWALHAIEGFLITPIAERTAVHLPPALTFSAQMLLAVIAGPVGIALAAPLTTVGVTLVRAVYARKGLNE